MNSVQAARNLEVIRTLMERAAVYRRALAPTSLLTGIIGSVAGAGGWIADIDSARGFAFFWLAVSILALAGAFVLVRRQALRDGEPFWSPPARRVAQALLPPLVAGMAAGLFLAVPAWRDPLRAWWLPGTWMVFYGCAMHAAGFFMPRGMRWFGWGFVLIGLAGLGVVNAASGSGLPHLSHAHLVMGATFGGLHLAYACYLYSTKRSRDETADGSGGSSRRADIESR